MIWTRGRGAEGKLTQVGVAGQGQERAEGTGRVWKEELQRKGTDGERQGDREKQGETGVSL